MCYSIYIDREEVYMATPVSLDDSLIKEAKSQSKVYSRSMPKQIEHWARMGRIIEQNPDLTGEDVQGILLGLQDVADGNVKAYKRGDL